MFLFVFVSCTKSDDNAEKTPTLMVKFSAKEFNNTTNKLETLFGGADSYTPITRAPNGSNRISPLKTVEMEAKEALLPFSAKGEQIRNAILEASSEGTLLLSNIERSNLINLDDASLAGIAYIISTLSIIRQLEPEINSSKLSKNDFIECLSVAIGFNAISGLYGYISGTAAMMSARTALQLAGAFVGRTLGWVGVAWALYDFGKCVHDRHKCVFSIPYEKIKPVYCITLSDS